MTDKRPMHSYTDTERELASESDMANTRTLQDDLNDLIKGTENQEVKRLLSTFVKTLLITKLQKVRALQRIDNDHKLLNIEVKEMRNEYLQNLISQTIRDHDEFITVTLDELSVIYDYIQEREAITIPQPPLPIMLSKRLTTHYREDDATSEDAEGQDSKEQEPLDPTERELLQETKIAIPRPKLPDMPGLRNLKTRQMIEESLQDTKPLDAIAKAQIVAKQYLKWKKDCTQAKILANKAKTSQESTEALVKVREMKKYMDAEMQELKEIINTSERPERFKKSVENMIDETIIL